MLADSLRIIGNDLYYINVFEDTPTIEAVPLTGGAARIIRSVDFLYPRFTFDSRGIGVAASVFCFGQGEYPGTMEQ